MTPKLVNRPQAGLFLFISYLLWASVTLRWITEFMEAQHPQTVLVSIMLAFYALILGLEPWITGSSRWRAHLYLSVQGLLVFGAIFFYYQLDFFAILLLPLGGQATFLLPRRSATAWILILILLNVLGQINQFGWPEALTFILLYTAALIFVAAFSDRTIQAEAARQKTESLLVELQEANRQLQALAGQAEELAIANERNRLARDLHDSVAQTLYGLTLQSEAASRQLAAGQLELVASFLKEIRHSILQTLGETRLLIFELRPSILEEIGLSAAIRARLEAVEIRSGMKVDMSLDTTGKLPKQVEVGVYRIAQEALNNVLKHAGANSIQVALRKGSHSLILEISDDGVGLPVNQDSHSQGGLGLKGMAERVEQIGGTLVISSLPGLGTSLKVEVPI